MVYTRADPRVVAGGNKGSWKDEQGLTRTWDSNRNASIQWQTAVKRSGVGAWHFVGGNQGSECALMTNESTYPMSTTEGWSQIAVRFAGFPASVNCLFMVLVTNGDAGAQANLKPCARITPAGDLLLANSNNSTNNTTCATLSLNTWYTILLHAKGGAGGLLDQELYCYEGLTGALIASCTTSWAIGNVGSSDVAKWGVGTSTDSTGLDFYMEDLIAWPGVTTNPGPCQVVTLRPTSVVAAGNFTATGAADIQAAIVENNGGNRTVTDLATTNASPNISSATGAFDIALDETAEVVAAGVTGGLAISTVTDASNAVMTGNASATATGVTATFQRRGNNGDTSYATVNSASSTTAEYTLADAGIQAGDEIHTVIPVIISKHTGSTPTQRCGVKSGATTSGLSVFPASSSTYTARRGATSNSQSAPSVSLDPNTGAQWTSAAIDAMTFVLPDTDALAREWRVTSAAVDVVVAQVVRDITGAFSLAPDLALSVAGQVTRVGAVSLAPDMALSVAGQREPVGTVGLAPTMSLSVAGQKTAVGAVAFNFEMAISASGLAPVEVGQTAGGRPAKNRAGGMPSKNRRAHR